MNPNLFKISNLVFSYSGSSENHVLEIEELSIPRGKLVVLIGGSGSGKSTLLEALGLMNHTAYFNPESNGEWYFDFFPNRNQKEGISFKNIWEKPQKVHGAQNSYLNISEARRNYLSFIFQQANLMGNFSAYENICLSQMIQDNLDFASVIREARTLMDQVGLNEKIVSPKTKPVNLSGGQRQRLTFVRALNTNFTVLLGDEPTGNLDVAKANELMSIIKSKVEIETNRSAIVVSHNIELALDHADQIIVIQKDPRKSYGEIKEDFVFNSSFWKDNKVDFKEFLKERFFIKDTQGLQEKNPKKLAKFQYSKVSSPNKPNLLEEENSITKSEKSPRFHPRYEWLFLIKESGVLMGKFCLNAFFLTTMIFFTFLAIGFANGGLTYLEEKMNDPFVNWLTVGIPWAKSEADVRNVQLQFNSPELMQRFNYNQVTSFVEWPMFFWDFKREDFYKAKGRSFKASDSLMQVILEDNNFLYGNSKGFQDDADLGIIVTRRFLEEFHYDPNTPYVEMRGVLGQDSLNVPIPIRAVVEEIPGKSLFAYTPCLFRARYALSNNTFDIRHKNKLTYFIKGNYDYCITVKDQILDHFYTFPDLKSFSDTTTMIENIENHRASYQEGWDLEFSFLSTVSLSSSISLKQINKIHQSILNTLNLEWNRIRLIHHYQSPRLGDCSIDSNADNFSIYFQKLDSVRAFASYLFKEFNTEDEQQKFEVDIAKIKEKENFFFLSKITSITANLLILFGLIGISLYVANLLSVHLSKVKMNLGTFMAFGLSQSKARNIYFQIIVLFVFINFLTGLILSWIFGRSIDYYYSEKFYLEEDSSYFILWDMGTVWPTLLLFGVTLLVSWITINRILSKTPGDLIYNR